MSDREYLSRRAAQEEERASIATHKTAAVIHSAMAAEYRRRLLEIETEKQSKAIWPHRS
ncbi:hypothetical protein [Sphingomonas limnosediminicola]|uniref:hypothetical protein n=1 Tax=Sphingomonas limnosediminicola TaxID=940133 RepID=UPI0031D72642